MIPSLSTQLQRQHQRERLRHGAGSWRVSSELPVSLQALAATADGVTAIEPTPAQAAVEPVKPDRGGVGSCRAAAQASLESAGSTAGLVVAATATALLPARAVPILARPSMLAPTGGLPPVGVAAETGPKPLAAAGPSPQAEAIALLVWLLLVMIDGGLSLSRLLRSPAPATGLPTACSGRRAGATTRAAAGRRALLRLLAANQPAVAIS